MIKIATALDRPPSHYFKKWVAYHTQLFDKSNFIFIDFSKDIQKLKQYLEQNNFQNIIVLKITDIKRNNILLFESNLNTLLQNHINLDCPLIIHCPLTYLANPQHNIYNQFTSESAYLINRLKNKILENKFKFIFLDSDELIIGENILDILKSNFTHIAPKGYTVIQNQNEDKLNWDNPIYKQRSFWKRDAYFYDKPIIIQEDIDWGPGRHLHHEEILKIPINDDIILFHLRDVCFDYLFQENQISTTLYPDKITDHRDQWESKETYSKWIEERQKEIELIPENIINLLKKYHI